MTDVSSEGGAPRNQTDGKGLGLPIDVFAAVPGLNPRDMSVLIVGGLGKGITLNAGVDNGDGTATLLDRDLQVHGGLRLRFPPGASGPHAFAVTVISGDGHVRSGSLTVEPGLMPLEAGFHFSVGSPQAVEGGKRLSFPLALSFGQGMGRMVGDIGFCLKRVPEGVEASAGLPEAAEGDGSRDWRFGMSDLSDLGLIVPVGMDAFDLELTVEAKGQSGGRLNFSRTSRVVPPGTRGRSTPVAAEKPLSSASTPAARAPAEAGTEPQATLQVADWLTGNDVFIFASGHGGDLFEGGYGWNDQAPPSQEAADGDMELRVLSGGPVISGPDPVTW